MKRSLLEIYALAVCFVTVVCFVIALGVAIYSLVQIARPDFTMSSWEYDQFQSNDAFWAKRANSIVSDKTKERPSEEVLTKRREAQFVVALRNEQRAGGQSLVKALIVVLIDIVVFAVHWIMARRARTTVAA